MHKNFLHDLFADHIDFYGTVSSEDLVSQNGINCHFDDLVVTASYTASSTLPIIHHKPNFQQHTIPPYNLFYYSFNTPKDLRGPPYQPC